MNKISVFQRSAGALLLVGLLGFAPACGYAAITKRVSVANDGSQRDDGGVAGGLSISSDGCYVVFISRVPNPEPGNTTNINGIFVRDLQDKTTKRVTVTGAGEQANGSSGNFTISGNGRYVAFSSDASNLVQGDTNGQIDIFVRDLQSNVTKRISVSNEGLQANGNSGDPSISSDGRYVAFSSYAFNLVPNDTTYRGDIFVRDLQNNTIKRVSVSSGGVQANSDSFSSGISGDGRYVVFSSLASNLVPNDTNTYADAFIRDLQNGITKRVSVSNDGKQVAGSSSASGISSDGRYVAFDSAASGLVPNDNDNVFDIFVRDLQNKTTKLVSVASDGTPLNGNSLGSSMSGDGRYLAFYSEASNLVPGDINNHADVFVRDLQNNTTKIISVSSDGMQGNNNSFGSSISLDGRYVAFASNASNLVPIDTNECSDVFVHDLNPPFVASGFTFLYAPSADFTASVKTNLPNATLTLKNSNGDTIATTTSDGTGSYRFEGLAAGDYTVSAQLVRSGQPTLILSPPSRPVTVVEADVAVPAFKLFSIFGIVKGPRIDGTTGQLKNVVVTLKNSNGDVLATRTTIEDGRFSFGKLAADTYVLSAAKTGFTFPNASGLTLPGTVAPFAPALKQNLNGTRNPPAPGAGRSGTDF